MCDSNNQEVFDQIHSIAEHLLATVTEELPDENKKKLRHGLNLIISLSGFQHNMVTQSDLEMLEMTS
ncbi:MAG: hypothetical protein HQ515_05430 [Phycisphaeraceae bacterium]|nr:hypothetical protein [Phycisphaeraceae bacterium]